MYSTIMDYEFQVDVYIPNEEPLKDGFPVLFVLDGARYSLLINQAMENQTKNRLKTKVEPMIIVGVDHKETDTEAMKNQRFYQFTAPAESYTFPLRRGKQMKPATAGGAEKFLRFLIEELRPEILEKYAVNKQKMYLYGHSLGGLFVLWNYLTHPGLFARYIALSPSIWWNDHELLSIVDQCEQKSNLPLYITVGGEENDMVDDALNFYEKLTNLQLPSDFYIAQQENHASVIPTTISRILRFLSSES